MITNCYLPETHPRHALPAVSEDAAHLEARKIGEAG